MRRSPHEQRFQEDFAIYPRLISASGQGKVFVAWDRTAEQQVACKAVSLAGVNLSCHQDALNEASMQTVTGRPARAQSIKLLRKIHRLEVEYEILKDLSHVCFLAFGSETILNLGSQTSLTRGRCSSQLTTCQLNFKTSKLRRSADLLSTATSYKSSCQAATSSPTSTTKVALSVLLLAQSSLVSYSKVSNFFTTMESSTAISSPRTF